MAKTDTTRRRKQQSKIVTNEEGLTEAALSTEQTAGTEDNAPPEITVIKQEGKDQDDQVSLEKENKEEGDDDNDDDDDELEKRTNTCNLMTTKETTEAQTQAASSADAIECTGSAHGENPETKMEPEDIKDEQEFQTDTATEENESTPQMTEKGKKGRITEENNGNEPMIVNGKRKARSNVEPSPTKKPKLINDGFCLFVGNLNHSKTSEEIIDSLCNYSMTQSLLVQNIRLDKSRKFAYMDLASELDLTKALTLNGEMILDKPMRIAKAKVKSEDRVKVKAPVDKKVKDARCLFVSNIPYDTTKKEIKKIFHKAISVRFPGKTKSPSKGIAFVEFRNKTIASKVLQKKQGVKIQGRVLILDSAGKTKVTEANNEDSNTKAEVPPNNTLFVNKLSYNVTEKTLKKVFQNAVRINMPQNEGKSKGFAFVEFATVADAEKALQSSQNIKICKRGVQVQFSENQEKSKNAKVQLKTLVVMGLTEKTSEETLKSAFEGALSARVILDKDTGASKRFGFVEFESEENCKAVKEAMEDCEIDGSKVTVAFAKHKGKRGHQGAREGLVAGRSAGHGGHRSSGGRNSRGGRGHGDGKLQDPVEEVENKS